MQKRKLFHFNRAFKKRILTMKTFIKVIAFSAGLLLSVNAISNDGYLETWSCVLTEGHTLNDVREANSNWVSFMKENVDSRITSHILVSVIGNSDPAAFSYIDFFPSLEAWLNQEQISKNSVEPLALNAALTEVNLCEQNRLWEAEES
jgi:hypothetical protein